ncbi:hypothetical protein EDC01DRAFT_718883 [Geopyxis carbonaria]|nr:hypothetical protein EDC01DRAFT_718883 [Geopyxis carbonaria]
MPKDYKPKSPLGANITAHLPASVEQSYRQKCKEIKKRIVEIESSNDLLTSQIQRARRAIQRMRLERAFLLQQLEIRTDIRVEDSEGSPSPPPTPSQKPLRVKRPRKDAPPIDSPMRQQSPSPPRDSLDGYPFVSQTFNAAPGVHATDAQSPTYISVAAMGPSGSSKIHKPGQKGYSNRSKGGPKRPPNAYMIFCERERDAVRERESGREGFDMHKALAQAWRDLKTDGQKPYFDEYEKNREKYNMQKVSDSKDAPSGGSMPQLKRAVSAGSSVIPAYEGVSPAPGSTNDEADEQMNTLSDSGFTAVNR